LQHRAAKTKKTRNLEASATGTVNSWRRWFYFSKTIGIVSGTSDRYGGASLRLCVLSSIIPSSTWAGARGDWPMAALAWQRAAATAAANELTFSEILLCHSVPILFRCRSAFLSKKQSSSVLVNFYGRQVLFFGVCTL